MNRPTICSRIAGWLPEWNSGRPLLKKKLMIFCCDNSIQLEQSEGDEARTPRRRRREVWCLVSWPLCQNAREAYWSPRYLHFKIRSNLLRKNADDAGTHMKFWSIAQAFRLIQHKGQCVLSFFLILFNGFSPYICNVSERLQRRSP